MLFEASERLVDNVVFLAEGEAHHRIGLAVLEEYRERDQRDLGFLYETLAKLCVGLIGQAADAGGEEIGAFAGQDVKAETLQAGGELVALALQLLRQVQGEVDAVLQTPGDAKLERGGRGEGDELVRLAYDLDQRARARDPADLPAGEREHLAGRADAHAALAHAGE